MTHALAARKSTQITETKKLKPNGGRGIRTPERVTPLTVFKTAGFNHSPIPPLRILSDSFILRTMSRCRFGLFCLAGHDCHRCVTGRKLRHRPRFCFVITMCVPHRGVDGRMTQQLLDGHEVHAGSREARSEGMPERVPG